jgi:sarcosine oxidase subunit delta
VPDLRELTSYLYFRRNVAGVQREWWYHRFGCETWFLAERDTRTNEVLETELASPPAGEPSPPAIPDTPAT